ncbi:MAG: DUF4838 domain-containing protein [Candidatus Marinimicrobia bacterium]|nr:DUF4838 domain-containing protein [Candidatus Neomarinimicrobiota bacterium]
MNRRFSPRARNYFPAGVFLLAVVCAPVIPAAERAPFPAVIIHPARPTPTERFAAAELQEYVARMTGRLVPLRAEAGAEDGWVLRVGRTSGTGAYASLTAHPLRTISAETAVIAPAGGDVLLFGGGDRGTLYAVYAFLERQGCRWYEPGPDGEVIPERTDLWLPPEPVVEQPRFAVRELGRGAASPAEAEAVIDWSVKNRLNRNFNLRLHPAWRERGGQVLWQHICHNTPWLLPNDPWFETHPEYFSLYNGRRIPQAKEGGYLCTTNPDMRRAVADFIIRWFDNHPDGDAVPISPSDGDVKWCECANCMAQGGVNFEPGPAGHMTRRQVEFINAVAAMVAEQHPDRYLVNLAYSRYVWPYAGLRTAPNVINQVAHGYAGNGSLVHSIYSPWNAAARDIFETWAQAGGAGIGIWDYFILHVPDQSGSPMTPLGFGGVAADMIHYLADFPNPYKVYFTQAGDALHAYNPFLYYAIARLAWDPTLTIAALRADYAARRFGPAAEPVAEYLALLDETYAAADWNPSIWRDITVPSARVFTPEFLARGGQLLATAAARLPEGSEPLARMITALNYAETTVLPKQLLAAEDGVWRLVRGDDAYVFNPGAPDGHAARWQAIHNRAQDMGLLDASMARVLFRARSRAEPLVWLENDRLRLGVLPGVGGRLLRLVDRRHPENNLFHEPLSLSTLTDPGATYFRYGGYEEYTRSAFASPGWELALAAEWLETADGRTLQLEGVTAESVRLTRQIRVAPGAAPVVHLSSRLTNEGAVPFPARLRVHPEFQLTPDLEATGLFYRDAAGAMHCAPVTGVAGADTLRPAGYWGLLELATGRGFIHHYPAGEAEAHIHLDRAYQTVNLELFAHATELAPGATCTLEHAYELLSGPDDMPDDLRVAWSAARQAPARPDRDLHFEPGLTGLGLRLGSTATPSYGQVAEILCGAGAFMAWVKPDGPPAAEHDALIMSAGLRQPDYLVLAIRNGRLVFYRHQRAPDGTPGYAAWLKVDAELPDWPPGSWHHVALNWRRAAAGHSQVELYADGERVAARRDLTMRPLQESPRLALGWDSSNASRPRLAGVLDRIRLLDAPQAPEAVRAAYEAGRTGESPGPAARLDLEMEGTAQ